MTTFCFKSLYPVGIHWYVTSQVHYKNREKDCLPLSAVSQQYLVDTEILIAHLLVFVKVHSLSMLLLVLLLSQLPFFPPLQENVDLEN